jgi:AAHS family cis,cis-muconate transporter-like MFS transporter
MNQKKIWNLVFISSFLGLMVDAMDLQLLSLSLTSLMEEFEINKVQAGSLGTYTLVGMAIGGMIGGNLADRFGRIKVISWTIALFSVGTFALAFTQSYWQFAIVRFIAALGLGSEYSLCNTVMAEYTPTNRRSITIASILIGWSIGYVVATLAAGAILPNYGWRPLFWLGILPIILVIYIRKMVPEPTGWKEKHATLKEAGKLKLEWTVIFADKKTRDIFLLWTFACIFLNFGYYGVNNWLPSYLISEVGFNFKNMTSYLVGMYGAMIMGKLAVGWLADKFGRRIIYALGALSTAIALPLVIYFHTPANIIILLSIFGFFYAMPSALNGTYMTESFKTEVRATAVAGALNLGRIGAALAPVLIGLIATYRSIGYGLALLGIAYALCGLIPGLFIKEKLHEPFSTPSPN